MAFQVRTHDCVPRRRSWDAAHVTTFSAGIWQFPAGCAICITARSSHAAMDGGTTILRFFMSFDLFGLAQPILRCGRRRLYHSHANSIASDSACDRRPRPVGLRKRARAKRRHLPCRFYIAFCRAAKPANPAAIAWPQRKRSRPNPRPRKRCRPPRPSPSQPATDSHARSFADARVGRPNWRKFRRLRPSHGPAPHRGFRRRESAAPSPRLAARRRYH